MQHQPASFLYLILNEIIPLKLPRIEPSPAGGVTTYVLEIAVYYVLTYECSILVLIKESYGRSLRNVGLQIRQLSVQPENQLIYQSWEL